MKRIEELGISPAPWRAEGGPMAAIVYENRPTQECASVCAITGERREADAALIAAAPSLYEALRLILEAIDALGFKPMVESDPLAVAVKCGEKALEKAGGRE